MKTFALTISILLLAFKPVAADELRVAVASNFSETIKVLSKKFESKSQHKIKLIFGATGRHYAQIKNGAPFDIFFAADSKRPQLLEAEGLISPESRFTYAKGKLVLWSPNKNLIDKQASILNTANFRHISIANPKLAPYGKAAQEFLQSKKLWEPLQKKTVRGENIAQAFHFVRSGSAELGLIAYSQVKQSPNKLTSKQSEIHTEGSLWQVPSSFYSPIEQQAVLLKDSEPAKEFLAYIKSDEAQQLIESFGYDIQNKKQVALEEHKTEFKTRAQ